MNIMSLDFKFKQTYGRNLKKYVYIDIEKFKEFL